MLANRVLFRTEHQNDFLNLLFVGDKRRSITGADVHLNTEQVNKRYDIILC